jgi:orotidine-5'-phosphate decarboxylase
LANAQDRLPKDRLIVALDVPGSAAALRIADQLQGTVQWLKVGLELYVAEGRGIVDQLLTHGFSVFLDLKLHDIPNTVAAAVRSAATSGASMLTVHTLGGPAMLAAAAEAAVSVPNGPRLLGVTVLTSMDSGQLAAIGIANSPAAQVERLARMAVDAGLTGLVCSPQEAQALRRILSRDIALVTPGIRPAGAAAHDQQRIATPSAAILAGADYLVIGRPITGAKDPATAAQAILEEMAAAEETASTVQ